MISKYRFLLGLLILIVAAGPVLAQQAIPTIVWDDGLPNCGNSTLEPKTVKCSITPGNDSQLNFDHNKVRISMTYSWVRDELNVIVVVENAGDREIPVNAKLWNLTGYKTLEDLRANRDPIVTSRAKKPPAVVGGRGMVNTTTGGLPTNSPVTREPTTRQTTNPNTGQILNPNSRVLTPNPTSSVTRGSSAVRTSSKPGATATSWTEVPAQSELVGEVRFAAGTSAKYAAVSFNINGTAYVYRLIRP